MGSQRKTRRLGGCIRHNAAGDQLPFVEHGHVVAQATDLF